MSIDEAIAKYKEITNTDAICPAHCNIHCDKCVQESEQIAERLELLKWYEQGMEDIPSESGVLPKDVYHAGYNKALDDFANTLKENYDYLPQIFSQEAFGRYVDEYAEQLKAGGRE